MQRCDVNDENHFNCSTLRYFGDVPLKGFICKHPLHPSPSLPLICIGAFDSDERTLLAVSETYTVTDRATVSHSSKFSESTPRIGVTSTSVRRSESNLCVCLFR